jgi:hypothetical protein
VNNGGLEVLASLILGTLSGMGIMVALYDHKLNVMLDEEFEAWVEYMRARRKRKKFSCDP